MFYSAVTVRHRGHSLNWRSIVLLPFSCLSNFYMNDMYFLPLSLCERKHRSLFGRRISSSTRHQIYVQANIILMQALTVSSISCIIYCYTMIAYGECTHTNVILCVDYLQTAAYMLVRIIDQILFIYVITGRGRMTVAWYGNKGMRRDANKIQVNGQMTNGQIARRIGWQDGRGQMNSARCKATKLLHDSDTRLASKW